MRQHHAPIPDPDGHGQSGFFIYFRDCVLDAESYVVRCHIQAAQDIIGNGAGELVIECADTFASEAATAIARLSIAIGPVLIAEGDHLVLRFEIPQQTRVEIRGHVTHGLGRIHLRRIVCYAPKPGEHVDDSLMPLRLRDRPKTRLRGVMIGTNGECNASCSLCPTNKAVREHLPTGIMPSSLFRKIINGLADGSIDLENNKIGLGLFGEPLMDPLILQRVRYIRTRLPRIKILLNTNAGPFNERRHAELVKYVTRFSVHVEALSPELYGKMMSPLRAENVFPKIERLIALAPGRVNIAVPISKRNIGEFAALREYWIRKGANHVGALSLGNRTTDSLDYYGQSLGVTPTVCTPAISFDLAIDWDGTVLACCRDFMRKEPLGNIYQSSMIEIIHARRRAEFAETLRQGCWNKLASCRDCKVDQPLQWTEGDGDSAAPM